MHHYSTLFPSCTRFTEAEAEDLIRNIQARTCATVAEAKATAAQCHAEYARLNIPATPPPPPEPPTGTYIRFVELDPKPKTRVWAVTTLDDAMLGTVSWYGPWRKYAFHPQPLTVYESVCLVEIAWFCTAQTKAHNARNRERRTGVAPSYPNA